ncbi:hypothetical protein ACJX0J_031912, partial [Zea mays]
MEATEEDFVWSFFCITCYIVVLILHVATHIPSCTQNYDISIYFKIKLQQAGNFIGWIHRVKKWIKRKPLFLEVSLSKHHYFTLLVIVFWFIPQRS